MKIGINKVVEFTYELEVDGSVVDRTTKERPLDYIHGTGSLLPKLEEHIEGMEAGAAFDVTLAPADAYGEIEPEKIIDLPSDGSGPSLRSQVSLRELRPVSLRLLC